MPMLFSLSILLFFFAPSSLLALTPIRTFPTQDILRLRVDPPLFSPNGDGFQDQAFFYPVLKEPLEISHWRMDITDGRGKRFRRLTGSGFPALIRWDGFDKQGRQVPEGNYRLSLQVWSGRTLLAVQNKVVVDVRPPQVDIFVASQSVQRSFSQKNLIFEPRLHDESRISRWQIQVLDLTGRTVYLFWSTGPARQVQWQGYDQATGLFVPQGHYRCAVQAWDEAGNQSDVAFADFFVDISASDIIAESLENIQPLAVANGLLIQLERARLFENRRGEISISDSGIRLLKEVAILINAYPDTPVFIDGYADSFKEQEKNKNLSNVYAWTVYNRLVRLGNVKPMRMNVRARGQAITAERRKIRVPPMGRGVEITIQTSPPAE